MEALDASSSGVSALTVICSLTSPTCSETGIANRSPMRSSMPSRAKLLKPVISAVSLYVPGSRYGIS